MSGTSTNGRTRTLSAHEDARAMIERAEEQGVTTVWDRLADQQPQCGYCALGLSCRNCAMGPCRIDPFGEGPQKGVCGADADVIVARNLGRTIAAGSSSHSDHGRDILETFGHLARGETTGYRISRRSEAAPGRSGGRGRDRGPYRRASGGRPGRRAPGRLRDTRAGRCPSSVACPAVRRAKWDCARHHATRHRPRERRDAPPHAHGRGQRLREHPSARVAHRACPTAGAGR